MAKWDTRSFQTLIFLLDTGTGWLHPIGNGWVFNQVGLSSEKPGLASSVFQQNVNRMSMKSRRLVWSLEKRIRKGVGRLENCDSHASGTSVKLDLAGEWMF